MVFRSFYYYRFCRHYKCYMIDRIFSCIVFYHVGPSHACYPCCSCSFNNCSFDFLTINYYSLTLSLFNIN